MTKHFLQAVGSSRIHLPSDRDAEIRAALRSAGIEQPTHWTEESYRIARGKLELFEVLKSIGKEEGTTPESLSGAQLRRGRGRRDPAKRQIDSAP